MRLVGRAAALLVLAALAGCVAPRTDGTLESVRFDQIQGWSTDTLSQTLPALHAGCRRLAMLPPETPLGGAGIAQATGGRAGQWSPACVAARSLEPGDAPGARRFYETWFQPYRIDAPALVTGYYEPEVRGALAPGGGYRTPLLARPSDLVQAPAPAGDPEQPSVGRLRGGVLVPYWTRAEIEAGRAAATARPLLWLADPADLFFLQVQGSGRVRLPDGVVVRVGYDGKNGQPYTPIGRVLVEQGALSPQDVTMQSIRAWLAAHPGQAGSVMDRNADYVFFRVIDDARPGASAGMGPPGALGVHLQPGRTAAVDRRTIPLAAPVFVDTTDPLTGAAWHRLLLAQDLGTDITGPGRVDVFLGAGEHAAQLAGRMHQPGTTYVLLPRPVP